MDTDAPPTAPQWERSALLTIDMQNDFGRVGGAAYVVGTEDVADALRTTAQAFRQAGLPVIHAARLYQRDGSNAESCRRDLVRESDGIAAPGSEGAELIEELRASSYRPLDADRLFAGEMLPVGPSEWVMFKPRWSAFFGTGLHEHLARMGVSTLVIGGCNLPNCPRATIFDASSLDYRIVLAADAISKRSPERLDDLEAIGVRLMPSAQVGDALNRREPSTLGRGS
jgi:nicotinamidase-related amidase